jgi:hypothetical protein
VAVALIISSGHGGAIPAGGAAGSVQARHALTPAAAPSCPAPPPRGIPSLPSPHPPASEASASALARSRAGALLRARCGWCIGLEGSRRRTKPAAQERARFDGKRMVPLDDSLPPAGDLMRVGHARTTRQNGGV